MSHQQNAGLPGSPARHTQHKYTNKQFTGDTVGAEDTSPKTLATDTDLEARTESAVTSSTLHHSMQPCNPGMNRQQGEL